MDPISVLVGPTAGGKSSVALALAPRLGAEIVSLDSMLLYRGMDIGTDKPIATDGVRHHLIDVLEPTERFDLKRYLEAADEAIAGIIARGRRVLVVGGTGLYLMGLLKGVFEGVPRDPALRERLAAFDTTDLHARLTERDPETAARLHPNDRRRITRALEVFETTGAPLAAHQTQFDGPDRYPARIAGIRWPREVLRERIRTRVDAMFAAGLVEEVRSLAGRLGPTAAQAVGYKEVVEALEGRTSMDEAHERIVSHTVRLMRRQSTWFKRFDVRWFEGAAPDLATDLIAYVRGTTVE